MIRFSILLWKVFQDFLFIFAQRLLNLTGEVLICKKQQTDFSANPPETYMRYMWEQHSLQREYHFYFLFHFLSIKYWLFCYLCTSTINDFRIFFSFDFSDVLLDFILSIVIDWLHVSYSSGKRNFPRNVKASTTSMGVLLFSLRSDIKYYIIYYMALNIIWAKRCLGNLPSRKFKTFHGKYLWWAKHH